MGRQAVTSLFVCLFFCCLTAHHEKSQLHVKVSTAGRTGNQRINKFLTASKNEQAQLPQQSPITDSSASARQPENDIADSSDVTTPCAAAAAAAAVAHPVTSSTRSVTVRTVDTLVSNDAVGKSEILWAIKLVMSHHSFRSSIDLGQTFQVMFPDSQIAAKFSMSKTKAAYTITHGLAPYFKETLDQDIIKCPAYVACFDEALNKISQRGQMDIVIQYWGEDANQVASRYFNSVFLGHATAHDLDMKFREGLSGMAINKLIQVSMDGLSVNWKFFEALRVGVDAADPQLLELGSCGLHVIHGAFQTGHKAAGWSVNEMLRSMYGLFKDSPARRADYISQTGNSMFPKKFCQVRWLANVDVATRAIEVFPHVKKYVETVKKLPGSITCKNVVNACEDPLSLAKLAFFSSVAAMFEPFLRKYQTAQPMIVFLYDDTDLQINRFLKKHVSTHLSLLKLI